MKTNKLFSLTTIVALFSISIFTTSCGSDPKTYDESGYVGTYTGYHHLDSAGLIGLGVGSAGDFSFWDTLVVSNGSDNTDGKLVGISSLLTGGTIEISLENNQITPVNLGNVSILGTTIKNVKVLSGSTGIWNSDKTTISTHLATNVTYTFNGADIPDLPVTINGNFNKQ